MGDSTKRRRLVRILRTLRVIFRWARICVWLVILVVVAAIAYLHMVGLPDFVKRAVLDELYSRGIEARFSEMRLSWSHEILVNDFTFGTLDDPLSPKLSVGMAKLKIDYGALFRRQFKVEAFSIVKGNLSVPMSDTNAPPLSLDGVQVSLKFLSGDRVYLENAKANLHGVVMQFDGVLTNFSAIRELKVGAASQETITNRADWRKSIEEFSAIANKVTFSAPPKLYAQIEGDVRKPETIRAALRLVAPGAKTPWGEMTRFRLVADCSRILDPRSDPFAKLLLTADRVATDWGGGERIDLRMTLKHNSENPDIFDGAAEFSAVNPHATWVDGSSTNWLRASLVKWNGSVTFQGITNFTLHAAHGELYTSKFESTWCSVDKVDAVLHTARTNTTRLADEDWGFWKVLEPFDADWTAEARGIRSMGLEIDSLGSSGRWRCPEVTIDKLDATLLGGELHAQAHLDVKTRALTFTNQQNFDPTPVGPLLGPATAELISEFTFQTGPQITNSGKVIVPPWTDRPTYWEDDFVRSLELRGTVLAQKGSFRKIDFESGKVVYVFTNLTWNLPRLHAHRADGDFYMDLLSNNETGDYELVMDTELDPRVLAVYLDWLPNRDQWLGRFAYSQPPVIQTQLKGRWGEPEILHVTSRIAATNFTFYGQRFERFNTFLDYTNNVLDIVNVYISQGDPKLVSPLVKVDFANNTISVTNGFSTMDPAWLNRIFDTNVPPFFKELGFGVPPSIQINGSYNFKDPEATDLNFRVASKYFRWKKLEIEDIFGRIDWVGQTIRMGGLQANLYGEGIGNGWGEFKVNKTKGIDVKFETTINNTELGEIVHGLFGKTNQIEGKLDATLKLRGNSEDEKSWQGDGTVNVRDAVLWNIPVFGIFSDMLNAIATDSGNSRARQASGSFIIKDGVLSSEDFQIRATTFRLLYRGHMDLHRIDGRVEAQLLRDTAVGSVFNIVLKPLTKIAEFRIRGPWEDWSAEPVYIPFPGVFSAALHPLQSLKSLLPGGSDRRKKPNK